MSKKTKPKKQIISENNSADKEFLDYLIWIIYGTFISVVLFYIGSAYLRLPLDRYFLYNAEDPGYVAGEEFSNPILGVHHFNDFLQFISYASLSKPYDSNLDYPNMYGPISKIIAEPFLHISQLIGVLILTFLTIGLWFYLNKKIILYKNFSMQLIGFAVFFLYSRPFLLNLDRGNIQGLVSAICLAWFFLNYANPNLNRNRSWIILVIAISLKAYCAVLLIWYLKRKSYGPIIKIFLVGSISNLILFYNFSEKNNVLLGIQSLAKGAAIQSGNFVSGLSGSSWILRLLDASRLFPDYSQYETQIRLIQILICLIFAVLISAIYMSKKFNFIDEFYLLFTLMTITVPISWDYNAIWLGCLLGIWFFGTNLKSDVNYASLKSEFLNTKIVILIGLSLIPIPINWVGGLRISVGVLDITYVPIVITTFLIWKKRSRTS